MRICAVAGVLPLPILFACDSLGLPPDSSFWISYAMLLIAIGTSILLLAIHVSLINQAMWKLMSATVFFCALVIAQAIEPLALTLIPVYRQPVVVKEEDIAAVPCAQAFAAPLFAHISDLHITNYEKTRDGKLPGNDRLAPILESINLHHPKFLVVSGDITDLGQSDQWSKVRELLNPLAGDTKVFFSTGNHDLNHFFGADPTEHPWNWFGFKPLQGMDAEPRIFRAASFQAERMPDVLTYEGKRLLDKTKHLPRRDRVDEFQDQIVECVDRCIGDAHTPDDVKVARLTCPELCRNDIDSLTYFYLRDVANAFPLTFYDSGSRTAFFALTTSMGDSTASLRNAIGTNGALQVDKLRKALAKLPSDVEHIVIVQHHPPVWSGVPKLGHVDWPKPWLAMDQIYTSDWTLAVFLHNNFDEEDQIYQALQAELNKRPGVDALFAFGHRHEKSLKRAGRIIFEEAPNLATSVDSWYGYYLVGIEANQLKVTWCQMPHLPNGQSKD